MSPEEFLRAARAKGLVASEGPRTNLPHPGPAPGEREAGFTARVIDLAHAHGWLAFHPLPLRTAGGWATGTQGDAGYPDLTLAKGGRVLLAELKVGRNQPTAPQRRWVREAGASVWRPEMWELIVATLRG